MKHEILVTKTFPGPGLDILSKVCTVDLHEGEEQLSSKDLIKRVEGKFGVLCFLSDRIDREVMDAGSALKVIANFAVGYNNIDIEYARAKGIFVTNTPEVLTDATADIAWSLILTLTRRIIPADSYTREGKFEGWTPFLFLGTSVQHKVLGILGMGRIGQAVAKRGKAFGMDVAYHDVKKLPLDVEKSLNARYLSFDELLGSADVLTIHVPLTQDSRKMIGERELAAMKKGSFLINAARGEIVDEKALVRSLGKGHLAGAGLDVYEKEPAVEEELKRMENVVILPHIGSATREVREKMGTMCVDNIIAVIQGRRPPNSIF